MPEAYPGQLQLSKKERFAAIVKLYLVLTTAAKLSILDVCGSPGFASAILHENCHLAETYNKKSHLS